MRGKQYNKYINKQTYNSNDILVTEILTIGSSGLVFLSEDYKIDSAISNTKKHYKACYCVLDD